MSGSTRRNFLIASGAAGVVAAVSTAADAATPHPTRTEVSTPAGAQPLVAHIADPASGALTILVGDREVEVHDRDLVGRITRAAKEA